MTHSTIIENLLGDDAVAWETANLLREHYDDIVRRRGTAHFDQVVQMLPDALFKAIGGQWYVSLAGPLSKKKDYPLRIRNTAWSQDNGFVIGFEYQKNDFRGDACFGLIHDPVNTQEKRRADYPDQLSTQAPGYRDNNWWLAMKIISSPSAPTFVTVDDFVTMTKELMGHYDKVDQEGGIGWLSSLEGPDTTNKAA